MVNIIVPIMVLVIIVTQFYFFTKNCVRMVEFRDIFKDESSWNITKSDLTGFVSGISGHGNKVFSSIVLSINKYLGNNSGSVIDFQLLKDAVDRHSDSIEDDINTQTPVPLYCGLVGTMLGVICGLFPLIQSGTLIYLLSGAIPEGMQKTSMDQMAANGINELLTGVAWAMVASIFGIILTTLNSLLFKRHKLREESGKNSFLAWMQSSLLPELPSDTSEALNKLVVNLNKFNDNFASNTEAFRTALGKVNDVYDTQDHIIQNVREMDVMKMAKANVSVLKELQSCTEQIHQFSNYLTCINQYTVSIKTFTDKFDSESERLHVLEEIRNFFNRHKEEISKETADSDNALREALKSLRDASSTNIEDFQKNILKQSESFKEILDKEKETFEQFSNSIKSQFSDRLEQMPMLERNLNEISAIPASLEKLIQRIEQSNLALSSNVSKTMNATVRAISSRQPEIETDDASNKYLSPWMKWLIIGCVIIMTIACATNTAYTIIEKKAKSHETTFDIRDGNNEISDVNVDTTTDTVSVNIKNDTIKQ